MMHQHVPIPAIAPLTRPPGFMPITAVEMAGGGLGPEPPANKPPAVSFIFLAYKLTASPAVNSSGYRWLAGGQAGRGAGRQKDREAG
jgi:hypothetical protein